MNAPNPGGVVPNAQPVGRGGTREPPLPYGKTLFHVSKMHHYIYTVPTTVGLMPGVDVVWTVTKRMDVVGNCVTLFKGLKICRSVSVYSCLYLLYALTNSVIKSISSSMCGFTRITS